jgi:hypothetical protein
VILSLRFGAILKRKMQRRKHVKESGMRREMNDSLISKYACPFWRYLALLMILLFCNGCFPGDTKIDDLSFEEAQELVPFRICRPAYVPTGLGISPNVRYHADFGDPMESDVTISIVDLATNEIVLEINERYAPGRLGELRDDIEKHHRVQVRDLLGWLEGWPRVDELQPQVETNHDYLLEEDGEYYLITQLTEPENLTSVMIRVAHDPVGYSVYSLLPLEEMLKVAYSLENCQQ